MTTSSIPENSPDADLSRLARMAMSLFDRWSLSSEDQAFLLALAAGDRAALVRYRQGAPIGTTRDQYDRIGHSLGIHKSLRLLFPGNRDVVCGWTKMHNRAFGGMTPVDAIKKYGFVGLLMVRTYLDRARTQQIDAINPARLPGE